MTYERICGSIYGADKQECPPRLSRRVKIGTYADVAELAASSSMRSLWEMKRDEDGTAVKISRRSKPNEILGTASGHAEVRLHKF